MKEGDEFFCKACYMSAQKKYSEALLIDKDSAVAYSSRSACHLSLNNPTQERYFIFNKIEWPNKITYLSYRMCL